MTASEFKESMFGGLVVFIFRFFDCAVNYIFHQQWCSVSAWLGKNNPGCALCRWLSRFVETDHCTKAAYAEGLLP